MIHTQTCTQDVDLSKASFERKDLFQEVTNTILAKLEENEVPWLKSWSNGIPANAISGKNYRGINLLLLGFKDFPSRYWLTFKQAKDEGGHVRKGERGSLVVFWSWKTPEQIEALKAKLGRDDVAEAYPFIHRVFNLTQCEGVKTPENDVERFANSPIEAAERIVREMPRPPTILHRDSSIANAGYSVTADYVAIPPISRFKTPEEYYSTLFHELVHSTAHEMRLARPIVGLKQFFGKEEQYSKEELIAELGSSFLCGLCGFGERVIENQAAYIKSWLQVLANDSRMVMEAASAAQRAVDWITGVKFED